MANDDKTEKPTPKHRTEARKKGQVAKSPDLNGAGVLAAGLIAVIITSSTIVSATGTQMVSMFAQIAHPASALTAAGLNGLFHAVLNTLLRTVAPIAGICVAAAVLLNVAQTGGRPSPQALKPTFSRINPAKGFKNIFGTQAVFTLAKSLVKVAVVGAVVALALLPDLTHLGASVGTAPADLDHLLSVGVIAIAVRATIAYLLIGVVDYVWQRRKMEKSLKMSKQEVKNESKNRELPPEVRSALRRRQIQAARARMMAAVPKADVVVTNPTHFAVALSYDGTHPAPVVVAKGQDLVAAQIRRVAEEHDIPIVTDPPLARELHRTVEIGQMIPAELYAAVAQVLAFVYKLAARKRRGV
jgi:flagellar biosynthetic protein FlhB